IWPGAWSAGRRTHAFQAARTPQATPRRSPRPSNPRASNPAPGRETMLEGEGRARLSEALARCLTDPVLRYDPTASSDARWISDRLPVLERLGAGVVFPGEDAYPAPLAGIPDEPTHLFHLGGPPLAGTFAVALVGSRQPTPSGLRFAEET